MIAKIEDQIHKVRLDEEEKRCKELEQITGKKVPRRKITKWSRPGAEALCQESDFLSKVYEYDYDLSDNGFQNYCLSRGVLNVAGEKGSKRWDVFLNHNKTRNQYLSDHYFHFAQEVDGKRYKYTDDEMETGWKIILIGRGELQDCWELYSQKKTDQG